MYIAWRKVATEHFMSSVRRRGEMSYSDSQRDSSTLLSILRGTFTATSAHNYGYYPGTFLTYKRGDRRSARSSLMSVLQNRRTPQSVF